MLKGSSDGDVIQLVIKCTVSKIGSRIKMRLVADTYDHPTANFSAITGTSGSREETRELSAKLNTFGTF